MLGIYEKAIIEIEMKTIEDIQEKETKSSFSMGSGLSGITDKLKGAASKMSSTSLGGLMSGLGLTGDGDKVQYQVQFNPSKLRINASGKKSKSRTGIDVKHKKAEYGMLGVRVMVTIPLIFDSSDNEKNIVTSGIAKKMKKSNSVAEQVEKFIKAVKNPYSRKIRFSWGKLLYEGELSSVSAEYTMFAKDGNPIRANVDLTILCKNEEGGKYWDNVCNDSFEGGKYNAEKRRN